MNEQDNGWRLSEDGVTWRTTWHIPDAAQRVFDGHTPRIIIDEMALNSAAMDALLRWTPARELEKYLEATGRDDVVRFVREHIQKTPALYRNQTVVLDLCRLAELILDSFEPTDMEEF